MPLLAAAPAPNSTRLLPGDWVEVRPYAEIRESLDARGQLQGTPFMPEMLRYCGQRLRVYKRADKTCAVSDRTAIRRMEGAVHLEAARCDGAAHGGCQGACLLFWKEAWLRRVDGPGDAAGEPCSNDPALVTSISGLDGKTTYVCQATELWQATCHLPWYDGGQYVRDLRSGGVGPAGLAVGFASVALGRFEKLRRRVYGLAGRTPSERLDLAAGEVVEVRPRGEIDATLDTRGHNRGLWWDPEMYHCCGKRFNVLRRLDRVIDEGTGRMRRPREPTVVLEGVTCSGAYHRFCSRSSYVYWREIWLRRV